MRHRLEATLAALCTLLARALPRAALRGLGANLGALCGLLLRRRRRIALDNLAHAFPALDARARSRIHRDCWRHFGAILFDALAIERLQPADVVRLGEFEGLEHLRAGQARGRGVLVFSAHFGEWELAALLQGWIGFPLVVVARPLDNPYLEPLLARGRQRSGNRVLYKKNAMREMLRELKRGGIVALLIDQDARGEGVFVDFFGRPASTTPGLALLAQRTGAAVVPCFSEPLAGGRVRVTYSAPVEATGVQPLTQECTRRVEEQVRRRPELWLWMHARWKTTPQ